MRNTHWHARMSKLHVVRSRFKEDFARTLSSAKHGHIDPSAQRQILEEYQMGDLSPEHISNVDMFNSKAMDFIHTAVSAGAIYVRP